MQRGFQHQVQAFGSLACGSVPGRKPLRGAEIPPGLCADKSATGPTRCLASPIRYSIGPANVFGAFRNSAVAARPTGQDGVLPQLKDTIRSLNNALLGALPRALVDRLVPNLRTIELPQGLVVFEVGDEIDQIYFPQNGMFSLRAVMRNGKAIETASVGREGVVGAMTGFGLCKSLVRVVVQLSMTVSKIAVTPFRRQSRIAIRFKRCAFVTTKCC